MIGNNFPQVLGFYVHTTMSMLQFQFHFGFFQVELPFSLFPPAWLQTVPFQVVNIFLCGNSFRFDAVCAPFPIPESRLFWLPIGIFGIACVTSCQLAANGEIVHTVR